MKRQILGKSTQSAKDDQHPRFEINLLIPVLILVGIGIIMVYSSSSAVALKKFGNDYYFF